MHNGGVLSAIVNKLLHGALLSVAFSFLLAVVIKGETYHPFVSDYSARPGLSDTNEIALDLAFLAPAECKDVSVSITFTHGLLYADPCNAVVSRGTDGNYHVTFYVRMENDTAGFGLLFESGRHVQWDNCFWRIDGDIVKFRDCPFGRRGKNKAGIDITTTRAWDLRTEEPFLCGPDVRLRGYFDNGVFVTLDTLPPKPPTMNTAEPANIEDAIPVPENWLGSTPPRDLTYTIEYYDFLKIDTIPMKPLPDSVRLRYHSYCREPQSDSNTMTLSISSELSTHHPAEWRIRSEAGDTVAGEIVFSMEPNRRGILTITSDLQPYPRTITLHLESDDTLISIITPYEYRLHEAEEHGPPLINYRGHHMRSELLSPVRLAALPDTTVLVSWVVDDRTDHVPVTFRTTRVDDLDLFTPKMMRIDNRRGDTLRAIVKIGIESGKQGKLQLSASCRKTEQERLALIDATGEAVTLAHDDDTSLVTSERLRRNDLGTRDTLDFTTSILPAPQGFVVTIMPWIASDTKGTVSMGTGFTWSPEWLILDSIRLSEDVPISDFTAHLLSSQKNVREINELRRIQYQGLLYESPDPTSSIQRRNLVEYCFHAPAESFGKSFTLDTVNYTKAGELILDRSFIVTRDHVEYFPYFPAYRSYRIGCPDSIMVGNVDCSSDGVINGRDIAALTFFMFTDTDGLCCPDAADMNLDGMINVADLVLLIETIKRF